MTIIFKQMIAGLGIAVKKQSKGTFTVQHGATNKPNLTYEAAALALGACIMEACCGGVDIDLNINMDIKES